MSESDDTSIEIEGTLVHFEDAPVLLVSDHDAAVGLNAYVPERLVAMSDDVARFLRRSVGSLASSLRPDLESIGANKATVRFAVKVAVKNGKLTSFVSEVGIEGSIEVAVEFTRST